MSDVLVIAQPVPALLIADADGEPLAHALTPQPVAQLFVLAGVPGPAGPAGPPGPSGAEGWISRAAHWSAPPTLAGRASVAGEAGDVWLYTAGGTQRFRFVADDYDAALDAFYSSYTAGVLSGLIVARG